MKKVDTSSYDVLDDWPAFCMVYAFEDLLLEKLLVLSILLVALKVLLHVCIQFSVPDKMRMFCT